MFAFSAQGLLGLVARAAHPTTVDNLSRGFNAVFEALAANGDADQLFYSSSAKAASRSPPWALFRKSRRRWPVSPLSFGGSQAHTEPTVRQNARCAALASTLTSFCTFAQVAPTAGMPITQSRMLENLRTRPCRYNCLCGEQPFAR